jgi:hypothetical protein
MKTQPSWQNKIYQENIISAEKRSIKKRGRRDNIYFQLAVMYSDCSSIKWLLQKDFSMVKPFDGAGIVSRYRDLLQFRRSGVRNTAKAKYFSTSHTSISALFPPSFMSDVYRGCSSQVDHQRPSSSEVMNEYDCTVLASLQRDFDNECTLFIEKTK